MDRSNKDLMQTWRLLLKGFFVLFLVACIFGGCSYLNRQMNMDDDNIFEQVAEDIIESQLGLPIDSIDFTPNFEYE